MPRQVGETPAFAVGYGAARVGAARDGGAGREHRENNWHGLPGLHGEEKEYSRLRPPATDYAVPRGSGFKVQGSEVHPPSAWFRGLPALGVVYPPWAWFTRLRRGSGFKVQGSGFRGSRIQDLGSRI